MQKKFLVVAGIILGLGIISTLLPSSDKKNTSAKNPDCEWMNSYYRSVKDIYPNSFAFVSDTCGFFQKASNGQVEKRLWRFMGVNCEGPVSIDMAKQGFENTTFKKASSLTGYCWKEIERNQENKPACDELEGCLKKHNYLSYEDKKSATLLNDLATQTKNDNTPDRFNLIPNDSQNK
jgi:hypothetical protein